MCFVHEVEIALLKVSFSSVDTGKGLEREDLSSVVSHLIQQSLLTDLDHGRRAAQEHLDVISVHLTVRLIRQVLLENVLVDEARFVGPSLRTVLEHQNQLESIRVLSLHLLELSPQNDVTLGDVTVQ